MCVNLASAVCSVAASPMSARRTGACSGLRQSCQRRCGQRARAAVEPSPCSARAAGWVGRPLRGRRARLAASRLAGRRTDHPHPHTAASMGCWPMAHDVSRKRSRGVAAGRARRPTTTIRFAPRRSRRTRCNGRARAITTQLLIARVPNAKYGGRLPRRQWRRQQRDCPIIARSQGRSSPAKHQTRFVRDRSRAQLRRLARLRAVHLHAPPTHLLCQYGAPPPPPSPRHSTNPSAPP